MKRFEIIRDGVSLASLQQRVQTFIDLEHAELVGAPFRDDEARQWCQALMIPRLPPPPEEIRLKEPKRNK